MKAWLPVLLFVTSVACGSCIADLTDPSPALRRHLGQLGYDQTEPLQFSVLRLGGPRKSHHVRIVEEFTEALAGHRFPVVVDGGREIEERRQMRAALILPRPYLEWLGLVARALAHRHRAARSAADIVEFNAARFALYRQFEVLVNVTARLAEGDEFDAPAEFLRATTLAWPTLHEAARTRALAFAARPAGDIRRRLREYVLECGADSAGRLCERHVALEFHRRLLENRDSLRRIPR